jgi:F-type H+-transporting ATPase subunit epsilon
MKLLKLTIARVDMPIFDGEVVSVTVPGFSGEMTIMADHAAIISPLKAGTIVARREDGEEESVPVSLGTLEVSGNHATILI